MPSRSRLWPRRPKPTYASSHGDTRPFRPAAVAGRVVRLCDRAVVREDLAVGGGDSSIHARNVSTAVEPSGVHGRRTSDPFRTGAPMDHTTAVALKAAALVALIILAVSIALMVTLQWLVTRTRLGTAMRAAGWRVSAGR